MAVDIGKAQTTINLVLVLGIVGAVGYGIYKLFNGGPLDPKNPDNQDPETGEYIGPLNALNQWIIPQKFPGGGAVAGSSETYTGAAENIFLHPISSIESLFGWDKRANVVPPTGNVNQTGGASGSW